MTKILVNETNLYEGIRKFKSNPKWDRDFHNSLYKKLLAAKQRGFNAEYLDVLLYWLWDWAALRPRTKEFLKAKGMERMPHIESEYRSIVASHGDKEPDLAEVNWEELEKLFSLAKEIKGIESPVFASKMCHFILPGCYFPVDGQFTGLEQPYKSRWIQAQQAWVNCLEKNLMIDLLKKEIGEKVMSEYPWATKITELCIGASGSIVMEKKVVRQEM